MLSIGRTWFICCTACSEHMSEGLVVIFSMATIASRLFYFLSHAVYSALERLAGCGAQLRLLIWKDPDGGVS